MNALVVNFVGLCLPIRSLSALKVHSPAPGSPRSSLPRRSVVQCLPPAASGAWLHPKARGLRGLGALVLLALTLAAGSPVDAQVIHDPDLTVELVTSGLGTSVQMVFIGPDDLLVIEQYTGLVRRVTGGVIAGVVLDLAVNWYDNHRGLIGIALHPLFASNGTVYLHYMESSTGADTGVKSEILGNRIKTFHWDGAALVDPQPLLELPYTPGPQHYGGVMRFGPDDKLYTVIGDISIRNGKLQNNEAGAGPDTTSSVLRLNDDGSAAPGNPFAGVPGYEIYYAYGIRNSYGLAFDPLTGTVWQTENGPNSMDELNRLDAGANSGWLPLMGPDALDPESAADLYELPGSSYADPQFSWLSPVAPTALEFLDSEQLGARYVNDLFCADVRFGRIYHFELDAARRELVLQDAALADRVADSVAELQEVIFGEGFGHLTDLKRGPDGNLYALSYNPGSIYRIRSVGAPTAAPPVAQIPPDGLGEAGGSGSMPVLLTRAGALSAPVELSYSLPRPAHVLLAVYDVRGQLVVVLVDAVEVSGGHQLRWDGRDERGRVASSGIYFARLQADEHVATARIVLDR